MSQKGPKKPKNIFWMVSFLAQTSPTRWVFWEPTVAVYQLAFLWEAVFGFSEVLFEDTFNAFADFRMGDLGAHLHWVFRGLTQNDKTPVPHPPYSLDLTASDFVCLFISPHKRLLIGKYFA